MSVQGIAVAHDWWPSGWNWVLPHQGFPLHMLVATADVYDLDGDLDDLMDQIIESQEWNMLMDTLDAPVRWAWVDDPTNDPEQLALDTEARHRFETAMHAAGRPLPETVRQLAHLMADFGVFHRSDDSRRWRSADPLPLPAEVLPLPAGFVAELDAQRWRHEVDPYAQAIIRYMIDRLDRPASFSTSVQRLSQVTGLGANEVRAGLGLLITEEFGTTRDGIPVASETLLDHARFTLAADWDRFAENRFQIRHGEPGEAPLVLTTDPDRGPFRDDQLPDGDRSA